MVMYKAVILSSMYKMEGRCSYADQPREVGDGVEVLEEGSSERRRIGKQWRKSPNLLTFSVSHSCRTATYHAAEIHNC